MMFKKDDRVVLKDNYLSVPKGAKGYIYYCSIDDPLALVKFDNEGVIELYNWRLELIKNDKVIKQNMIDDSEMYVYIDNDSLVGDETFNASSGCDFHNETYSVSVDAAKEEAEYNEQDYIIYKLVPVAKVEFKKETIVTVL